MTGSGESQPPRQPEDEVWRRIFTKVVTGTIPPPPFHLQEVRDVNEPFLLFGNPLIKDSFQGASMKSAG